MISTGRPAAGAAGPRCTEPSGFPDLKNKKQCAQCCRKTSVGITATFDPAGVWRGEFGIREAQEVLWPYNGSGPGRPAGYERGVTAGTVSEHCQQGQLGEAVEALGVLVETGGLVSQSLLQSVVKQCVGSKNLVLGRRVHALIVRSGYEADTFLCNNVLRMYASHVRLQEAMDVFMALVKPDAFTWSAIISAHVRHGQDKEAVQLYHRMRMSRVKPDGHVFVAALQACARGADLESGKQVHGDVLGSEFRPNLFVWNCLVDMYAKCGRLDDAQRVFDGLGQKDVVTWNTMIAGYSQRGMGQEALRLYSEMEEEGIAAPTVVTFVCVLQACASVGRPALEQGRQLHAQIGKQELQTDVVVGSSLVNMYAKCGSLDDARDVFNRLGEKNVVTWTALIAGYSQQGMGHEALRLYSAMEEEGMAVPDSVTFACLLQACASVGAPALEKGKQLHVEIGEQGLQADVVLGRSLVNMYAKCGSLEDAQRVFEELPQKDVVTWTALIGGYSQQGMGQEALQLYSAMQKDGITAPDSVTFVCLLQACASLGVPALENGKQLHAQIGERGLQADVFVANSLVNMYARCGSLENAQRVFDGLGEKNVVTWNAMIAGYSQQGRGQEALHLFSVMEEEATATPNSVTFVSVLQACASVGTLGLETGKQLHGRIRERGIQADVVVGCSLVHMYAKCGSLEDAQGVFDLLPEKDVVTWTTMIAGYSQKGIGQEALHLYSRMQEEGISIPDSMTFVCLLQACASVNIPALENGKQLHTQIKERGLQTDVFVANSLVNMYAKCGNLQDAQAVFDELEEKNVVTWNAMIAGYSQQGMGMEALRLYGDMQQEGLVAPDSATFVCLLQACASVGTLGLEKGKQLHAQIREGGLEADVVLVNSLVHMYSKCGSLQDARTLFDKLLEKDVVTWNAMISGFSQQGMGQEALLLYRAMQDEGNIAPNSVTFVCVLQACANLAALHLGRQLHAEIQKQGLEADTLVAVSLINMYGKSGTMVDAKQVFEALPERDVITWNALIAGYTRQGDHAVVFDLLHRMRADGVEPTSVTFLSVLTVCSHAGLVIEGRKYFKAMSRLHGITATTEHYTCMVDLLGRAGKLDEALSLAKTMPVLPDAAVWRSLLGSCQKWSNVEVGRHAFSEAVKLDSKDAAVYVLMANVYTGAQMWEEAQEIQARRIGLGVWKQPGQSWWTDLNGMTHSFFVGDEQHPEKEGIYLRLEQLSSMIQEARITLPQFHLQLA